MNKLCLLLVVLISAGTWSQVTSIPSTQLANDMVYDGVTDRIYITIPASDAQNGNSIGIVNPYSNTLESTLFVGDNPVELAIADNGQFIYVAFDEVAKVRRYTLNPLTFDMEFELGSDPNPNYGNYYARDIAVMPGQPNVVAVSRKIIANLAPDHAGIGIYDNGVMRPVDYYPFNFIHINKIKFKDATTLIGHAGSSSNAGTTLFSVNASGINLISDSPSVPNPHPYLATSDFVYRQNKLYFINGKRIDISSSPIEDGQYGTIFTCGGNTYDELNNLICFGDSTGSLSFYQNGFWDGYLRRYNPSTFQLFDSYQITTSGEVNKMISCGDNCYGLLTSRLTVVRPSALGINSFSFDSNFLVSPNPVANILYLKNNTHIAVKNVYVYNYLGEVILSYSTDIDQINLSAFSSGVYFLKITDRAGVIFTKKIIKD